MSNISLSHPSSVLNQQGFQLEPIPSTLETSVAPMLMIPVGSESKNDGLQQVPPSNEHMRAVEHLPRNHGQQKMSVTNSHTEQVEPRTNEFRPQQFMMPSNGLGGMQSMYTIPQQTSQNKRKTSIELMSSNQIGQQVALPNKRMQVEHRPWMQQLSSPSIQHVPMQPISNSPRQQHMPQLSNKVVLLDSVPKKAGPQKKTPPLQPSSKVAESFGSVRSKLIESLTAALALVSQQQDSPSALKKNTSEPVTSPLKNKETSSPTGPSEAHDNASEKTLEDTVPSSEGSAAPNHNGCTVSQTTLRNENTRESPQNWKYDGPEFPLNPVMPEIDVAFGGNMFVKDDFLQGNGLTWAIDVDMGVEEKNEVPIDNEQKLGVDETPKVLETPEIVAVKIETELFKLYEGVNKKYKEKGRSLLFNLKDRSNPELRERVMSGDILPERLCSMTAEELASKELSEWRIAKAEELAQMVVLPDSDGDVRRLVKKTHKGEVQVEYEQDDTISVEVSAGVSTLPQIRPKSNRKSRPSSESDQIKENAKATNESTNHADQNGQYRLTIPPNEEGDLMLDEFKDVNFLPAIVSLDEFMESLDSEPPFLNIPQDAGKTAPPSDKDQVEGQSEFKSPISSKEQLDKFDDKTDEMEVKDSKSLVESKSSKSHVEPASVAFVASKSGQIWEGSIQLNPSAVITVIGLFKSGDKTSTKDWSSPIDIKGRVRLEAFEKFIHDLPMSRSRAIMITHFVLKEGSSEEDFASLSEVTGSYLAEDRVGYAEPCEGVELYICPAHMKTLEMFKKHLPKNHIDALDDDDGISNNKGLIGVVIWRKILPQNRHHNSSKRSKPQAPVSVATHGNNSRSHNSGGGGGGDDDDDLPPGFEFGPPVSNNRDDDDLPEFKFSGNSNVPVVNRVNHNSRNLSKPVSQMRELVQKYGQPATTKAGYGGVPMQTWKKDNDDDDMPEWRPQSVVHQHNSTTQQLSPVQTFHQQALRPHTMTHGQHLGVANPHQTYHSPQPPTTVLPGPPIWGTPPYGGSPRYPSGGQSRRDGRRS